MCFAAKTTIIYSNIFYILCQPKGEFIMSEQNKKIELLGSAPIPKALLAMGLPTMIGMMINALYNLVDAYFVGGLGTSQMGAISVAFPLGRSGSVIRKWGSILYFKASGKRGKRNSK